MKLMLILGTGAVYTRLDEILQPLPLEAIVYRHIQKAMDNIEEIDPDVIILDAGAFPRQWKSFVQFIRETERGRHCPVILIKGGNFSREDRNKAAYLGVDSVVNETFTEKGDISSVQSIINAALPEGERKIRDAAGHTIKGKYGLLITNPVNGALIAGEVKTISLEGLVFYPDRPYLVEMLPLRTEIPASSLRAGRNILSPVLRLIKRDTELYFEFISFPGNEQVIFENYLSRTDGASPRPPSRPPSRRPASKVQPK